MHTIYGLYFENWRLTLLTIAMVATAGILALNALPKQEDPYIGERFATLNIYLPGASAELMESQVAELVEVELRDVREIKEIETSSQTGVVFITMNLHDWIARTATDSVWSKVRSKLEGVKPLLPPAVLDFALRVRTVQADTLVVGLSWKDTTDTNAPLTDTQHRLLQRLTEELSLHIRSVSGTRSVELLSEAQEQVLVELDPARLVAASLTVQDVAQALLRKDSRSPAGTVEGASSRLNLLLADNISTLEQLRSLQVPLPGNNQIRLSDLATVRKSIGDPIETVALIDGVESYVVAARCENSVRVDQWVSQAMIQVEAFEAQLPEQVALNIIYDQSVYTDNRLNALGVNLLLAALIVLLVLVFFQGIRPALVIAVSLPLTCLGAVALMGPLGIGLQQMSVTGLIISLGLLIDNPIVTIDHYQHLRRQGLNILNAVRTTVGHLWIPLLASTLTTIFAFMPIGTGSGSTVEFIGSMAIVVVLAVATSLFLSLTVVLAINAYLDRALSDDQGRSVLPASFEKGFSNSRLTRLYRALLDQIMRRPIIGIVIACVLPTLGFFFLPTLERNFFPPVDRDMFQMSLVSWPSSSLQETRAQVEKARAILANTPGIRQDIWFLGGVAARPFYNVLNAGVTSNKAVAKGFVYTDSALVTQNILPDLQRQMRRELPDVQIRLEPFSQGPPISAPLEVRLFGSDLQVLHEVGEQLRRLMLNLDEVTYSQATLSSQSPLYTLHPIEASMQASGLTESTLSQLMAAGLNGLPAGNLMDSGRQLPIKILFQSDIRRNWQRLQSAPLLRTAEGQLISLEAVAESQFTPGVSQIKHGYTGQRVNEVKAWLMPFSLPSNSQIAFGQLLEQSDFLLPAGVRLETGGESEQSGESIATLLQTAVFFMILMLFSIVLSFASFKDAAIVSLTAVLSLGLAFFGLKISGNILGFTAIVGTLGLVGLSINGTIIVLSALKRSERALAGDAVATREAVVDASRHILATTATTVCGFLPLMLADDTFWKPLVWAIAGGVSGSALIALFMVPAIFRLRTRRAV
ncbi:MAG: efflux RND transporter permease subunit [Gammaproteobacteria bacterium]